MADLKALAEAVIKGDQNTATNVTQAALAEGIAPKTVLDEGLIAGMDVVGERFKNNEIYIPEVLIAARAMKTAMQVLEPELVKAGVEPEGRKFAPHVTLARLKTTPEEHVARYITENGLFRIPEFTVDSFHLYSSFLGSENAIHTVEATYQLEPKRNRKL